MLWSTAKIIRDAGFVVLEGASAEDAIKLKTQYHPAPVLLDVNLPGGDGVDNAMNIKTDPALPNVCIVLSAGAWISSGDQVEGSNRDMLTGISLPCRQRRNPPKIDAYLQIRAGLEALCENEKIIRLHGTVQDITERIIAQKQTLPLKEEWESTFNAVPDLICILDTKHTILRMNLAMATKLGLKPEETVRMNCYSWSTIQIALLIFAPI